MAMVGSTVVHVDGKCPPSMWNVRSVISVCIQGAPQMAFALPVLRGTGCLTPPSHKRKFKTEWLRTRSWLRYNASRDKMWHAFNGELAQIGTRSICNNSCHKLRDR